MAGYQVELSKGDGREAHLVQFSIDGAVVDLFDYGDFLIGGGRSRYFDVPVKGSQFKIEFTGDNPDVEPRIREINAILTTPPPSGPMFTVW